MSTVRFDVTGMSCAACVAHVEKTVRNVEGVREVNVSLLTNSMLVTFESPATEESICLAVQKIGYGASPQQMNKNNNVEKEDINSKTTKQLLIRLISSVAILLVLMYVSMGHMMWNWPLQQEYPYLEQDG